VFEECAGLIRERHPGVAVQTGHWGNDSIPFWAWATFRDAESDRELVFSVRFDPTEFGLALSADLMVGHQGPLQAEMARCDLGKSPTSLVILERLGKPRSSYTIRPI
jgi:hypothetical protein